MNFRFTNYIRILSAIFCCLVFGSCQEDRQKPEDNLNLNGRWDMVQASRNGKETKSLESAYFIFRDDNMVKTNLFGSSDSVNFLFEENFINMETSIPLKMKIEDYKNDTLILTSKLKVWDMVFYLMKNDSISY